MGGIGWLRCLGTSECKTKISEDPEGDGASPLQKSPVCVKGFAVNPGTQPDWQKKCLMVASSSLLHRIAQEALENSAEQPLTAALESRRLRPVLVLPAPRHGDALVSSQVTVSGTREVSLRSSSCTTNQ